MKMKIFMQAFSIRTFQEERIYEHFFYMNYLCTGHILSDEDPLSVEACTLETHGLLILCLKKFQCV